MLSYVNFYTLNLGRFYFSGNSGKIGDSWLAAGKIGDSWFPDLCVYVQTSIYIDFYNRINNN